METSVGQPEVLRSEEEKQHKLKLRGLAPRARFELATLRLTAECSTVELPGIRATYLFSF